MYKRCKTDAHCTANLSFHFFHKAGKSQSWTGDKPPNVFSPEIRWTSNEEKAKSLDRGESLRSQKHSCRNQKVNPKELHSFFHRNSTPHFQQEFHSSFYIQWPLSSLEDFHPGMHQEGSCKPNLRRSPFRAHTRTTRFWSIDPGCRPCGLYRPGHDRSITTLNPQAPCPWKQVDDIQPAGGAVKHGRWKGICSSRSRGQTRAFQQLLTHSQVQPEQQHSQSPLTWVEQALLELPLGAGGFTSTAGAAGGTAGAAAAAFCSVPALMACLQSSNGTGDFFHWRHRHGVLRPCFIFLFQKVWWHTVSWSLPSLGKPPYSWFGCHVFPPANCHTPFVRLLWNSFRVL